MTTTAAKEATSAPTLSPTSSAESKVVLKATMPWSDFFKTRLTRNRYRPLVGIPVALGCFASVLSVPFNPFNPLFGMEPSIVMAAAAIGSALGGYMVGASLSPSVWRMLNANEARRMDVMDRIFHGKIAAYRSQRGQSPYANTMAGTGRFLGRLMPGKSSLKSVDDVVLKQDFYGEKVKSAQDYRRWLRLHTQLNRDVLGPEAARIRGVIITETKPRV